MYLSQDLLMANYPQCKGLQAKTVLILFDLVNLARNSFRARAKHKRATNCTMMRQL